MMRLSFVFALCCLILYCGVFCYVVLCCRVLLLESGSEECRIPFSNVRLHVFPPSILLLLGKARILRFLG
jgi:hypothetical protein